MQLSAPMFAAVLKELAQAAAVETAELIAQLVVVVVGTAVDTGFAAEFGSLYTGAVAAEGLGIVAAAAAAVAARIQDSRSLEVAMTAQGSQ